LFIYSVASVVPTSLSYTDRPTSQPEFTIAKHLYVSCVNVATELVKLVRW
jgi:hypothetical protein